MMKGCTNGHDPVEFGYNLFTFILQESSMALEQYFCYTKENEAFVTKERPKDKESLTNFYSIMAPRLEVALTVYKCHLQQNKLRRN